MTARAQHHRAPQLPVPGPWRTFLLLGLLAGLFGMHALGSVNAVAGAPHHSPHSHARAMSAHTPVMSAESVCDGGSTDGGHVQHADPTCASGAVGAGPVLPALALDPVGGAVSGGLDRPDPALAPEGGRAPPSLAELQILRT
ncbi:hypothetical protein IM697_00340 [Streptomyces ferrugineus]|uniref:Uncharacterized protein n=1 Tax=Streptomyces ferrugineus TaxID=1413221 RepID=A0A7M2SNB2_9ACTN|nr:DUF6153 family protein [Streptomyces ferrugineus]QOV36963.1 hypothetical protein IM697_00340 [Streptomyces ferrugineus]